MHNTILITDGRMSVQRLDSLPIGQLSSCEYLIDKNNYPHIFGYIVFKQLNNGAVNNTVFNIQIDREIRMTLMECTVDGLLECNKEIRFIAKGVLLEKLRE